MPRSDLTVDTPAFEMFYQREFKAIVAIARALVRDGGTAEDLAQDAFVAAHRNWDRVSHYDNPTAWVRRVAVNKATSFQRRRGAEWRAITRLGGAADSSTMPDISHETEEVWNEVRRLPRRQAQAIALFYVGQLSIEEIAEVMDCQRGAVKSHLHRARTKLNQSLAAWDQETR
jgi:RNA polymerase sigma-70 factor (ECF subfamily)